MSRIETWNIGFGRIGEKRELKFALEKYWKREISLEELEKTGAELRRRHWDYQRAAGIDVISCNDFSWYDQTLDMIVALGLEPERFRTISDPVERYFAMARGDESRTAMEMTKWFNTNYHYIVPELSAALQGRADASEIIARYAEAKAQGIERPKINLIGPLTLLANAKRPDSPDEDALGLFDRILPLYEALLTQLAQLDEEEIIIQMEEPVFVTDKTAQMGLLIRDAYERLASIDSRLKLYVVSYFDHAVEAARVLAKTPVEGIGLDFLYDEGRNIEALQAIADSGKTLIAGVIDGRNIWRTDLDQRRELLESIGQVVPAERIILSPSCSLLHIPFTLRYEEKMDLGVKSYLAFATERLEELNVLNALFRKKSLSESQRQILEVSRRALAKRRESSHVTDPAVQERMKTIDTLCRKRQTSFKERIETQHRRFGYKPLATTTIGSFPQTAELRRMRRDYKEGRIDTKTYEHYIEEQIRACVALQERIDLEVLVHGEFERNDMVEYFGEQLSGVAFSENGWVQSYGSRCVKPPLIYGDVSRPAPMTVRWSTFAQSLTQRPMKGMLTGPVTILNWSFVRDDQSRAETCYQIALAIRDEVDDLQKAGIGMIQVDEAAFKEGYPLRSAKRPEYERFALESFWIATNVAEPETQIHTHMCYSEFNDIIDTIEAMDADVISIETARSGNVLLRIFKERGYEMEIGPGVYDIHSPRVPSVEEMVDQIHALLEVLPPRQLWINPDCGLKTRGWPEVEASLANMVRAVKEVRQELGI
jgi:5-methyltetrahydropteroyltriglutamate--homocysteine methyltransferase